MHWKPFAVWELLVDRNPQGQLACERVIDRDPGGTLLPCPQSYTLPSQEAVPRATRRSAVDPEARGRPSAATRPETTIQGATCLPLSPVADVRDAKVPYCIPATHGSGWSSQMVALCLCTLSDGLRAVEAFCVVRRTDVHRRYPSPQSSCCVSYSSSMRYSTVSSSFHSSTIVRIHYQLASRKALLHLQSDDISDHLSGTLTCLMTYA